MPLGSRQDEVGLILREDGRLVLRRDDGGTWHLDGPRDLDANLGRRVTLGGLRSGFDLIDVDSLLVGSMRSVATTRRVEWPAIVAADAAV